MDNVDFRKAVENVRGLRDIKIVTAKWKISYLVAEPFYHATNIFQKIY